MFDIPLSTLYAPYTMPKRKPLSPLGLILKSIAPKIGATVRIEPVWGAVGQITFKSGRHSYFRYNTLDLNPMGASEISRDKDYANYFMQKLGYPTVPGSKTFYSKSWAKAIGAVDRDIHAAYRYAKSLGFPVIVKPNSGSQGTGVALVHTKAEFYAALEAVFKSDKVALVQRPVIGKDYRIVVLDNEIISAYERIPLNVVGDGHTTITELLLKKQRKFLREKRDTRINVKDPRIIAKLAHLGFTLRSVPKLGEQVFLLDNANLSTGGDSLDVTASLHTDFQSLAIRLTRDMGLRLCGVDLMVEGDIAEAPKKYHVLEINSAPGLDHYASIGRAQEQIVEELYLKVLQHLERSLFGSA